MEKNPQEEVLRNEDLENDLEKFVTEENEVKKVISKDLDNEDYVKNSLLF